MMLGKGREEAGPSHPYLPTSTKNVWKHSEKYFSNNKFFLGGGINNNMKKVDMIGQYPCISSLLKQNWDGHEKPGWKLNQP